ncbi:MAG: DUF4215 domain-containing protein [Candidatus Woesearchaeota archaeon]
MIAVIVILTLVVLSFSAYAQDVGCCVSTDSCSETTTGSCSGDQTYYATSCSQVTDCNIGCCCEDSLNSADTVVTTSKHCDSVGGSFYLLRSYTTATSTYVTGCKAVCGLDEGTCTEDFLCSDGETVLAECTDDGTYAVLPGASCPSEEGTLTDTDGDGVPDSEDLCPNEPMLTAPEESEETVCDDGIDNDCDGVKDCNDPDCCVKDICAGSQACISINCGDGEVDEGEECDDGNTVSGDGCSNTCQLEYCGDGIVQPGLGEECDDGNTIDDDDCDNSCKLTEEAVMEAAPTECNDGIDNDGDGCADWPFDRGCSGESDQNEDNDPDLPPEDQCSRCGDGIIDTPNSEGTNEECDPGKANADGDCGIVDGMQGTCLDDCTCSYSCLKNPGAPVNFAVTPVSGEPANELTWEMHPAQDCEPDKIYLYRCSGPTSECKPDNIIVVNETFEGRTFYYHKDEGLSAESRYCYRADVHYSTGAIASSDVKCMTTGDSQCLATMGEFCMDNSRYKCDSENFIIRPPLENCSDKSIDPNDYVCMGPFIDGTTKCYYQSDCLRCNGLFGLFASADANAFYTGEPFPSGGEYPCSEIPSCYNDSTRTSINKYHSCTNITSCYDYRSEGACTENKCQLGGCEWVSSHEAYNELGVGVCRPKEDAMQNCSRCGVFNSKAQNRVYGDCDVELCKLHGDCYYSYGSCVDEAETSCWSYSSKEDCIGSGADAQNVSVNVQWDEVTVHEYPDNVDVESGDSFEKTIERMMKVSGDNKIQQESDDYFNFGTCKWVGYEGLRADVPSRICVKDADNNSEPDCPYGMENKECQIDNNAPETTFILDDIPRTQEGRLLLPKKIDIDYYTGEKAKVYFCIAEEGSQCYPNETSMCGLQKNFKGTSGEYSLYYFAEDDSRNLENVSSLDVTIDTGYPSVDASEELIDGSDGNDYKITLISDEHLTCSGRLVKGNGVPTRPKNTLDFEIDESFTREYYDLQDDKYYFEYECSDRAGNTVKDRVWLNRQGDEMEDIVGVDTNRIHNPKPYGPLKSNTVTLSVETEDEASCRYARYFGSVPGFDSMNTFGSDNGLQHTSTINTVSNEYYDFIIKCRFDDNKQVEGNDNDRIRFAVDRKGPEVVPVTTFEAFDFDVSQTWGRDQEIRLQCRDNYFEKVKKVLNMDFGCGDSILYKRSIGSDYEEMELDDEGISKESIYLADTGTHTIYHVANDTGNNTNDDFIMIRINNDEPEFDVEVYPYPMGPGSEPLDSISYGEYVVKVDSTKSLNDINMSLMVDNKDMPWSFLRSENFGKTNYFLLRIPYPEEGGLERDTTFEGTVVVTGLVKMPGSVCTLDEVDEAALVGTGGKEITINTKEPDITFAPPLKEFSNMGYPLKKKDGMYYTNESRLFITGRRDNLAVDEVWFYVLNGDDVMVDMADPQKTYKFTPEKNAEPESLLSEPLSVAPPLPKKGSDALNVMPLTRHTEPGNYIKIDGKERGAYGDYGKYYKIDWVENAGGGIAKLTLAQPLETGLDSSDKIDVYARPYPNDWFGEYIDLEAGNNTFYARPRSSSGIMPLPEETFTIFTDPNPPKVISQTPNRGTTKNLNTPISIVVREGIKESLLDMDSVKLEFNGEKITEDDDSFTINKYNMSSFIFYEMTYMPPEPLGDGTYTVNFEGKDNAGHSLTETERASPSWSFTIDTKAPSTPKFEIENGTFFNGMWYINRSPHFTIEFADGDNVDITAIYEDQPFAGFNVGTDCEYIRNKSHDNLYKCVFDPPLRPTQLESSGQRFIDDTFQIIVEAYKTLGSGEKSPTGTYYLDPLVIDNITPAIRSVTYPERVKVDGDVNIRTHISNEFHDLNGSLNGTILFDGRSFDLEQTNRMGSLYEFKWHTPYYDVSESDKKEINRNATLKISDYAGNYNTTSLNITVDMKVPDIESMHVSVLPTIKEQMGEYRTRYTSVIVRGNFTEDDISEIFIIPGSYVPGQNTYDNVSQKADIYDHNFMVDMKINGTVNETILNKMNVFLVDRAGYKVFLPLDVIADLEPPTVVSSRVS